MNCKVCAIYTDRDQKDGLCHICAPAYQAGVAAERERHEELVRLGEALLKGFDDLEVDENEQSKAAAAIANDFSAELARVRGKK